MLDAAIQAPLLSRIASALDSSPYIGAGKVRVEPGDSGQLRLHGRVETFFEKQMAQETIRHMAGDSQIENMVEVTW